MKRNDIKLIIIILMVVIIMLILFNKDKSNSKIVVYYENKVIKEIEPDIDGTYTVKGALGDIVLEVKEQKVRVKEETSPLHLCSKQGFISSDMMPIICLPNKIVVKFEEQEKLDGVVY